MRKLITLIVLLVLLTGNTIAIGDDESSDGESSDHGTPPPRAQDASAPHAGDRASPSSPFTQGLTGDRGQGERRLFVWHDAFCGACWRCRCFVLRAATPER